MRVLVTGGAGFIGSHLCRRLLAGGREVVVLDSFDDAYDPAIKRANLAGLAVHLVEGDLLDAAALRRALEGVGAVVHLAARAGVRQSLADPGLYARVNVEGTARLLHHLAALPGVPMVFASSSSVYGDRGDGPFREDDPVDRPVSPYAATKRAGELLCAAAHAAWGIPVTSLRFFTVYGPGQRPGMAIQRFVTLALDGAPLPLFGDGSTERDYTWVEDAVDAIEAALARPGGAEVINVGSAAPVRLDQLVDAIAAAVGRPVRVEQHPTQAGDVQRTHADIQRAQALLGWSPRTRFADGVARYVAWVRAARAGVLRP
jgi:UDP-glucuronate 4-epimerase